MTKNHKRIVSNLLAADIFFREAVVLAGSMVLREIPAMRLVANEIREARWHLDEAIAHTEADAKKRSKENLPFADLVRRWQLASARYNRDCNMRHALPDDSKRNHLRKRSHRAFQIMIKAFERTHKTDAQFGRQKKSKKNLTSARECVRM
jgi:hypothetical protein